MSEYKEKDQQSGMVKASSVVAQRRQRSRVRGAAFEDNRPETAQLRGVLPQSCSRAAGRPIFQAKGLNAGMQLKAPEPVQKKENRTGLPDDLKAGVENLSGLAMDDVRVWYNSDKPAQLNAHAYTQGTQIHVGPGQEKHLPHEAWHVVQQKGRRVNPTNHIENGPKVNDDVELEREADVMGERAAYVGRNELRANASNPMEPDQITNDKKLNSNGANQRQIINSTQMGSNDKAEKNAYMGKEKTERKARNTTQLKSTRHGTNPLVGNSEQKKEAQIIQLSPSSTKVAFLKWVLETREIKKRYKGAQKYTDNITTTAAVLIEYLKAAEAGQAVRVQREILEKINNHAIPKDLEEDLKKKLNELKEIAMREYEALYDKEINGNLVVADDAPIRVYEDINLLNSKTKSDLKHKELEASQGIDTGKTYTIAQTKHPLFVGSPEIADVQQGGLGDCYLMASLISIVNISPGYIKEMMRDNGDGTVTVRFFKMKRVGMHSAGGMGTEVFTPFYIKVKKSIVVNKGEAKPKYARGGVWVQMIEKAYAASALAMKKDSTKTAYEEIEGGYGIATLQHLLGRSTNDLDIPEKKTIKETLGELVLDEEYNTINDSVEDEIWGGIDEDEDVSTKASIKEWEQDLEDLCAGGIGHAGTATIDKKIAESEDEIKRILGIDKYNQTKLNEKYAMIRAKLRSEGYGHAGIYTPKQIAIYREIEERISQGQPMVLATKKEFKNKSQVPGGEQGIGGEDKEIAGMYRLHVYAVIGVEPQIKEKETPPGRLRLILVNPHAGYVPIYEDKLDVNGKLIRRMSTHEETKVTGGTFVYDLADVEQEIETITTAEPNNKPAENQSSKALIAMISIALAAIVTTYLIYRSNETHITECKGQGDW